MGKHNGLSDTQSLPPIPDPYEEPYDPFAEAGYDPEYGDEPYEPPDRRPSAAGRPRLQGAANRNQQEQLRFPPPDQLQSDAPRLPRSDQSYSGSQYGQRSQGYYDRRPASRPDSYRQGAHPPRQRTQPPPQAGIRRASYQDNLPEEDRRVPNRRPPQRQSPQERYDRKPKSKHRKRRKHSCLRRIILSVVSALLTIFLLYSGIVWLAIKQLDYRETGPRQITANIAEQDAFVRNILLIGTDSRDGELGRADTMIVLSFSKHNKSVTMTSLMRDSYVSIPGHGTDKLNAAYAYGGPTLLMDTIINNYGIPVDDYVCINFKAFVHVADALGGLKVEISDREAEEINIILQSEVNAIMGDDPMADFLPSGGTFILNGKQALAYARIRHVGNADFERTERQRTVLNLMLDKAKHLSPTAIPKMLGNALPELTTNMSKPQLYLLSLQTPLKLTFYDMQTLRLPADGTYSDQTAPNGQMVLAVDFDANHMLYIKAIHDPIQQIQPEIQPENAAQ